MIRALIAVVVVLATLAMAYYFPDDAIKFYFCGGIILVLMSLGTAPEGRE